MAKALYRVILLFALAVAGHALAADKNNPAWADLKAGERAILAPLSNEWDNLDAARKKKWLGVAAQFPKMNAEEQARIQRRMSAWSNLTAEQRQAARDTYRDISKLPPAQRQVVRQKWEEYRQLPDDERRQLTAPQQPRRN